MAIVEIRDKNNKPLAINTLLIEHIEGTATKILKLKEGDMVTTDYSGNPKVLTADENIAAIDWNQDVKIVMLNGTTYTISTDQLHLLQSRGELALRKANPFAY